jgi:hypothetical protein
MSTKRLQKTVIEGGRVGRNKWERRYSSKAQRAKNREYIANINKDHEYSENEQAPDRVPVYKEFNDKLSPMYRWLHSQVGRVWDEVKSEIFKTFDTRTVAGRHITYDHLLSSVEEQPDLRYNRYFDSESLDNWIASRYSKNEFYVDDDGILRNKIYRARKKLTPVNAAAVIDWLKGRVVGKVGNKIFWFVPPRERGFSGEWKCGWSSSFHYNEGHTAYGYVTYHYLSYRNIYNSDHTKVIDTKPVWNEFISVQLNVRQDKEFTKDDYKFWNQIPEWCQKGILSRSPTSPKPVKPLNKYHF